MQDDRPVAMFYCQHAVGIGHYQRVMAIAAGLCRTFRVVVVSGGPAPHCLPPDADLEIVQLEPLILSPSGDLASPTDGDVAAIKRQRGEQLSALFSKLQPSVLVTELFPFGRKQFSFELLPLVRTARSQQALIVCSIRDFLGREDEWQWERAALLANRLFDCILIHGDERILKCDVFRNGGLDVPTYYTGYVHEARHAGARWQPDVDAPPRIVVSVGGGRCGAPLLNAVLRAFRNHGLGRRMTATLLTGVYLDEADRQQLQRAAKEVEGIEVVGWVDGLQNHLQGASASVSQAGYNTILDLLDWGGPALVVPFPSTEQEVRGKRLAELDQLRYLEAQDGLDERILAEAIDSLLSFRPAPMELRMEGVAETARLVEQLWRQQRPQPARRQTFARRVCFASFEYPPLMGGIAKSAQRVVTFLADSGFEVIVFTVVDGESLPQSLEPDGALKVVFVPKADTVQKTGLALLSAIRQEDETLPFDVFHGFFLPMAYACLPVIESSPRPLIASIRGSDATRWLDDPQRAPLIRAVLESANVITTVSTDLIERVEANGIAIGDRGNLIINSITPRDFPRWRPRAENSGVVGTVGEFRPKKNIPLLVEAYAAVDPEMRRELRLVGYWYNPDEEWAHACQVRDLKLEREVRCSGRLPHDQVINHLPDLRVFVVSSLEDGLPNAILEAAAVGVPIVSTDVGGMRDVLVDGENALVVPSGDCQAMARALSRVLADDQLAVRLSEGALKLASRCNLEQERRSWREVYDSVLNSSHRSIDPLPRRGQEESIT